MNRDVRKGLLTWRAIALAHGSGTLLNFELDRHALLGHAPDVRISQSAEGMARPVCQDAGRCGAPIAAQMSGEALNASSIALIHARVAGAIRADRSQATAAMCQGKVRAAVPASAPCRRGRSRRHGSCGEGCSWQRAPAGPAGACSLSPQGRRRARR